jgi:very-short-patch-repair endonuclease
MKFGRQQPMGRFIVDFVCLDRKLIIDRDGGQHAEQWKKDAARDATPGGGLHGHAFLEPRGAPEY